MGGEQLQRSPPQAGAAALGHFSEQLGVLQMAACPFSEGRCGPSEQCQVTLGSDFHHGNCLSKQPGVAIKHHLSLQGGVGSHFCGSRFLEQTGSWAGGSSALPQSSTLDICTPSGPPLPPAHSQSLGEPHSARSQQSGVALSRCQQLMVCLWIP